MERLLRVEDGINALISPDPLRRDSSACERLVGTPYRAVKPDPAALEFASRVACFDHVGRGHPRQGQPKPGRHLAGDGPDQRSARRIHHRHHEIREQGPPALDLSKINFEVLAQRFKESKHKNTDLEVLKAAIRAQLEKMIQLNRTRADFAEKFKDVDRKLQRRQPEH